MATVCGVQEAKSIIGRQHVSSQTLRHLVQHNFQDILSIRMSGVCSCQERGAVVPIRLYVFSVMSYGL